MHALLQIVNLWDNPVFHRYRRSQLRLRKALIWYLAAFIVTSFVVSLTYLVQTNRGVLPETAARELWLPLLVIQGLIVLIKGTGRTSAGLIQDKIDQTLDYQRLTPVAPLRSVVGYLFGLPILEYGMFALTLPHLAFVVTKGDIPLTTVGAVYVAFFVCALFYHMSAIAIGMVMKRWVFGYMLSIFSVAFLNLFLAPLGSQLGLKFLQYLSVFPVIGQKVVPLMVPPGQFPGFPAGVAPAGGQPPPAFAQGPRGPESPFISFADPVPFFEWTISPFVFTLVLQTGLIVTFATMAVRRWDKASKHSLSKTYALGILGAFIVLFLGNLWPVITGQYLPFPIFGTRLLEPLRQPIAIALPLIYAAASWLLCAILFSTTVPTHHAYLRGLRRAHKLGRRAARPWDDDSANLLFLGLFVVVALIGYGVLYTTMSDAGYMDFLAGTGFDAWRLPLALTLLLGNTGLLVLVLQIRGTTLTALLLWILPILIAIVAVAAMQELTRFHTVLASVSPLALLLMSGILPLELLVPVDPEAEFSALTTGANTGIAFATIQLGLLLARWQQLRRTLR